MPPTALLPGMNNENSNSVSVTIAVVIGIVVFLIVAVLVVVIVVGYAWYQRKRNRIPPNILMQPNSLYSSMGGSEYVLDVDPEYELAREKLVNIENAWDCCFFPINWIVSCLNLKNDFRLQISISSSIFGVEVDTCFKLHEIKQFSIDL